MKTASYKMRAAIVAGILAPRLAFAQAPSTFKELMIFFIDLISLVLPLLVSLTILAMFWGLVKFIRTAGGDDHEQGRFLMIWGTIALFFMATIWGILEFLTGEFGFGGLAIPFLPQK